MMDLDIYSTPTIEVLPLPSSGNLDLRLAYVAPFLLHPSNSSLAILRNRDHHALYHLLARDM
jgi:hypothetical protein